MKPYQKVLGISIIALITGLVVLVRFAIRTDQDNLAVVAIFVLFAAGALTLVLMFSYRNDLLRKIFLYGMPGSLLVYIIANYTELLFKK